MRTDREAASWRRGRLESRSCTTRGWIRPLPSLRLRLGRVRRLTPKSLCRPDWSRPHATRRSAPRPRHGLVWSALAQAHISPRHGERGGKGPVNVMTFDPYSRSSLYIEAFHGDMRLSCATGFVYASGSKKYLISNWHVLSGRDPATGQSLRPDGGVPDRLSIMLPLSGDRIGWAPHCAPLVSDSEDFLWLQHPTRGQTIDVAALELEPPTGTALFAINGIGENDIRTLVAQDVFVVGFPWD